MTVRIQYIQNISENFYLKESLTQMVAKCYSMLQ